jgi:type II secretory pathway pseudopilin PulG
MKPVSLDKQGGATRLELAVATIMAVLLAGVLLNCIISYQGESERVAAKQLIGSLRTALAVRSAKAISTTGQAGLMALAHQNPMTWLQDPPENYLGEYYSPKKEALAPGNWYFDRGSHTLVYLPVAEKSFSAGIQKVQVFKVKLVRVSGPVNAGRQEKGSSGLVLDQMDQPEIQAVAFNNSAGSLPLPPLSEK